MRVTKPGGRFSSPAPTSGFPLDIQHGAVDEHVKPTPMVRLRQAVFLRTRVNIHPVFGKHHLLAYPEVRKLFAATGKLKSFEAMSLKGYFGFAAFGRGYFRWIKRLVNLYATSLPSPLRASFLNPYMLVRITR